MEQQNEQQTTIVSDALKMGLYVGVASVIMTLLFYLIDPSLFAKWWLNLIILVIVVVAVVIMGKNYRMSIGGYMSFGEAFKHGFIIFLVSGFISGVFTILLFQVIDSELKNVVSDAAIEQTSEMLEKFGMDEDQIEEALIETESSMEESFSLVGQIKGQVWAIAFYLILSLITGLIVRKEEKFSDVV